MEDVYGNSGIVGTWVNLVRDVDGASQIFAIHYTGEDQYMIEYGDQGYCIAVASDKETVVMQDYDAENEYNKWYISRIGTTQNYLFTNVATGNTLCYEYSSDFSAYRLYVKAYDEKGVIGEGTHERFIIQNEKFQKKANMKKDS